MGNGFSNKEMLERILNKLDSMDIRLNETHELASKTNGKVKLHTKLIWGLAGGTLSAFISLFSYIVKLL